MRLHRALIGSALALLVLHENATAQARMRATEQPPPAEVEHLFREAYALVQQHGFGQLPYSFGHALNRYARLYQLPVIDHAWPPRYDMSARDPLVEKQLMPFLQPSIDFLNAVYEGKDSAADSLLRKLQTMGMPHDHLLATIASALEHGCMRGNGCEAELKPLRDRWLDTLEIAAAATAYSPVLDTLRAKLASMRSHDSPARSLYWMNTVKDSALLSNAVFMATQYARQSDFLATVEMVRVIVRRGEKLMSLPWGMYKTLRTLHHDALADSLVNDVSSTMSALYDRLDWASLLASNGRTQEARTFAFQALEQWNPEKDPMLFPGLRAFTEADAYQDLIAWAEKMPDGPAKAGALMSVAMGGGTEPVPAPPPDNRSGKRRVIVDTDAGPDDLLALSFLLGRPDVEIIGITVVQGLTSVSTGAANVLRLLAHTGADEIPVYEGSDFHMLPTNPFPREYVKTSEDVGRHATTASPTRSVRRDAVAFLSDQLIRPDTSFQILALGPLTNIAMALGRSGKDVNPHRIVVMGGAVDVDGNLSSPEFRTGNTRAEWNIYSDARAADDVFRSKLQVELVSLDATNHVKLDGCFVNAIGAGVRTRNRTYAEYVLNAARKWIKRGDYYAWDPIAAVALVEPSVVTFENAKLSVVLDGPFVGQTKRDLMGQDIRFATSADRDRFASVFDGGLSHASSNKDPAHYFCD